MPKRLFSDKAWKSDKIRALPEKYRAEYAWIYSMALCDGTFECDAHKVWAACYATVRSGGRYGWTSEKVDEMLLAFELAGLLQRCYDSEGKVWGKWTNCEDCLPARCDWHKHQRGKGFLFEGPAIIRPLANQSPSHRPQGVGFGSDLEQEQELTQGAAAGKPTRVNMAEFLPADGERLPIGEDRNGRRKGDTGYFERGQYYGTSPKDVHKQIATAWRKLKESDGAYAEYPSKFPERWERLCDTLSVDIIVPAFELWFQHEGQYSNSCRFPADEFAKVVSKYSEMIIPTKAARPKMTAEISVASDVLAAKRRAEFFDVPATVEVEPDASAFLEEK